MFRRWVSLLNAFDAILCGGFDQCCSAYSNNSQLERLTREYRMKSLKAPLPLPLASAMTLSALIKRDFTSFVSHLAIHPQQDIVFKSVAQEMSKMELSISGWTSLLSYAKKLDASPDTVAYIVMRLSASSGSSHFKVPENATLQGSTEKEREEIRSWIVRYIRYHSAYAPLFLSSLCALTFRRDRSVTESEIEDLLETLQMARISGYVSPNDCGLVLNFSLSSSQILSQWRWIQFTSAKWNQNAASAAVFAFSKHGRFSGAVNALQTLASVSLDPNTPAKVSFIELLSQVTPPLSGYGDQLVEYWFSDPSELWDERNVTVAAALMFLHFRCGNYQECLNILSTAVSRLVPSSSEEKLSMPQKGAFISFICSQGVYQVGNCLMSEILECEKLRRFFFDEPLSILEEFASSFTVIAFCIRMARSGRIPEGREKLLKDLQKLKGLVENNCFKKIMRSMAEDQKFSASDTLNDMEEIASALGREVPPDLVAWKKLV